MLRDSEIEQANASIVFYQNVAGLQVAMNHCVLMRVQNGVADGPEKAQALFNRAFVLLAIPGERQAFDVLHHEKRSSIRRGIRIVQARDRWMVQLRQRALLDSKPVAARRRQPGIPQNLYGYKRPEV